MCSATHLTQSPLQIALLTYPYEEVGDVLLHQKVLAGVGNVFKSEICFLTGINPFCRVAALTQPQIVALIAARSASFAPMCLKIPAA